MVRGRRNGPLTRLSASTSAGLTAGKGETKIRREIVPVRTGVRPPTGSQVRRCPDLTARLSISLLLENKQSSYSLGNETFKLFRSEARAVSRVRLTQSG